MYTSTYATPAGDQGCAEDLDETGKERNDQAGLDAALFICYQTDGGVVEEYGNESADDQSRRTYQDQNQDSDQLTNQTCKEAEGNSVCITETEADCAVDAGNGGRKKLVSDTLEGSCQLCNEGTDAQLQDCQINGELQGGVEAVEYEVLGFEEYSNMNGSIFI